MGGRDGLTPPRSLAFQNFPNPAPIPAWADRVDNNYFSGTVLVPLRGSSGLEGRVMAKRLTKDQTIDRLYQMIETADAGLRALLKDLEDCAKMETAVAHTHVDRLASIRGALYRAAFELARG